MILITGAGGFIGTNLLQELTDDYDVRGMYYTEEEKTRIEETCAEAVQGDITDKESLEEAVEGVDRIIHLVAILDGTEDQFRTIHAQGTQNLLDVAPDDLDQFIYFSALGAEKESTPYFRTKLEAERRIKQADIPYTIFRPSIVFGENDAFINLIIDQLDTFPIAPILGHGQYRLQPIYVKDVAEIVHEALEKEECLNETFEIGGPGIITLEQIFDIIMEKKGKKKPKLHTPMSLASLGAPIARTLLNVPLSDTTLTMLKQENYVKESHYTDIFDVKLHSLNDMFDDVYL